MTQKQEAGNSKLLIWPLETAPIKVSTSRRFLVCAQWAKENSQAIVAYNQRIEKYGVFSDGLRRL